MTECKPAWHVTYYYLATGMEGRADTHDYGIVYADTESEAKDIIVRREQAECDPPIGFPSEFFKSCLEAKRAE